MHSFILLLHILVAFSFVRTINVMLSRLMHQVLYVFSDRLWI